MNNDNHVAWNKCYWTSNAVNFFQKLYDINERQYIYRRLYGWHLRRLI